MKNAIVVLFAFCLFSCNCNHAQEQQAPNYRDATSWAALPSNKNNLSYTVPPGSGFVENQAHAKVDLFYIHPTTFESLLRLNAPLDDETANSEVGRVYLRSQASIFNGSCAIYAPRYRQASLYAFDPDVTSESDQKKALDIAYSDVKSAFLYYLEHYNDGRPFVIASHSQGSNMAIRLVKEFIDGKALMKKLVVAYIVGEKIGNKTFNSLPACQNATQTQCFVTWATLGENAQPVLVTGDYVGDPVMINPMIWSASDSAVEASAHLGGVPLSFDRFDQNLGISAMIHDGFLRISPPNQPGYDEIDGDYHIVDFNLFYGNVRQNVQNRIQAYFAINGTD